MFDLLVKGGTLPDGTVAGIGIKGDQIAAIGRLDATATQTPTSEVTVIRIDLKNAFFGRMPCTTVGLSRCL